LAAVIGAYFIFKPEEVVEEKDPTVYVWDVEDSDLTHIVITLPQVNQKESFIKISDGDNFPWFFDDAERSPVDTERWGGGIPLLLSGPGADRIITKDATEEQLEVFGLNNPRMVIELTLSSGEVMNIIVGDSTPDGNNYYVKAPFSNGIATVDFTWYGVLASLVVDPPYAAETTEE